MVSIDLVSTQFKPYKSRGNTPEHGFYTQTDLYSTNRLSFSKPTFCQAFNTQLEPLFNKIGTSTLKRAGFINIKMLASAIWEIMPQDQPSQAIIQCFKKNLKQLYKNENLRYLYRNCDLAFMIQDHSKIFSELSQLKKKILYKQKKGTASQQALLNQDRFHEHYGGFIKVLIKTFGPHLRALLCGTWAMHALLEDKKRCHLIAKGKLSFTKEIETLYQKALTSVLKENENSSTRTFKIKPTYQNTTYASRYRAKSQYSLFYLENRDPPSLSHPRSSAHTNRHHPKKPSQHDTAFYQDNTTHTHPSSFYKKDNIPLLQDQSISTQKHLKQSLKQTKPLSFLSSFFNHFNTVTIKASRERKKEHRKAHRSHRF